MSKSQNFYSKAEHTKKIIFNAIQCIQIKVLILYEFQDYFLKSMNLTFLFGFYLWWLQQNGGMYFQLF